MNLSIPDFKKSFSSQRGHLSKVNNYTFGEYFLLFCKSYSSPVIVLEWPRGFQEVKVPSFRGNGTGWW
jgi:hypothetical protein